VTSLSDEDGTDKPKRYYIGYDITDVETELYIGRDYGRSSDEELIMNGIPIDNHYERFDLDEPENHQQSYT
jgi:hypothetical protein